MTDQQPNPTTAPDRAARWRAVGHWLRDTGLGTIGFLIVLTVALSGWTASFIGLHQFGTQHMDLTTSEAWLVPVTFDGAAAGLSLVVFRASINGRGAGLWRVLIVAFTALSSWINYVHISDPTGRWIACYMPPSAVILFEGLMSEARAAAARRNGHERARVHALRWVFDFSGTLNLYRQYVMAVELPEPLQQGSANLPVNPGTNRVPNPTTEPMEPAGTDPANHPEPANPTPRTTPRRTRRTTTDQPNQQVREPAGTNDTPSPAEQVKQVLNLMKVHGFDAVKLGFVMQETGMSKTTAYNRLVEARANWSEDQDDES